MSEVHKKRSVLWGAYRLKVPKKRAGSGKEVKTKNLYSYVMQGTVDRVALREKNLVYPNAYLLKTKVPTKTGNGSIASVQPKINPGTVKNPKARIYLWTPKIQDRFSEHIRAVGTKDYEALIKFTLSASDCRFSQLGIPTGLSFAKMATNMCRFTGTGAFKSRGGQTFVLTKNSKTAVSRKKPENEASEKEVKPDNAV